MRLKLLIGCCFLLSILNSAHAAEITHANKDTVIIKFDEFEELIELGGCMFVVIDGKKKGSVAVTFSKTFFRNIPMYVWRFLH
jgi:hypothetical protein